MVSNYITVVYKFFLRAHRKQFLHANASKNKQPQAFKHRADTQLSFHFAYCKATISKKEKNKNKNRSKSRPCSERHARLTGHQALARALGPRAEGLTSGGRTGPGRGVRSLSGATGSCLPTASADWKPGHSLVQTQRKGISQAQHLWGGGWVLARKASPSTPTPLGRLQVV